jgi:two-component system, sensor histidine kinase and response regulator
MTKILVIEDEMDLRENLLDLLEAEGFDVVSAANGQVGVHLAQEQLPDLIICDVMMPELDGHGVLTALRQNTATAFIPFIFLTAKGTGEDFRTGLRLGADDYLTKPYKQVELIEAVKTRLAKQTAIHTFQQATVQQMQQKIEELQQSNLLKDDFLSIASHELRGPMTNIKLAIQVLQNLSRDDRQKRYLDLLQAECSREISLLNDLLDLQSLEAANNLPKPELIDLQEWLPLVIKPFEIRAEERQQKLKVEIGSDLSWFSTDPSDLRRIMNELLNNACKYTAPNGEINFKVQGHDRLQIVVGNAAEIPADDLAHLFERFYRVSSLDRWQQGGTGLGLTLVKKLIERSSGSIYVTSSQGWTEFIVHLPPLQ